MRFYDKYELKMEYEWPEIDEPLESIINLSKINYSRAKRLIISYIKQAQTMQNIHWTKLWKDVYASLSIYDIERIFEQLYAAGKVNTPKWYDDNIKLTK